MNEDVEVFKAQKGIMSCKSTPVVKKVTETTIKLTPLDIPINDYLSDIFDDDDQLSIKPLDNSESNNNFSSKVGQNEYSDQYTGEF